MCCAPAAARQDARQKNRGAFASVTSVFFDHAVSIQVALYAALITLLWLAEALFAGQPLAGKWRHSRTNLLLLLAVLPIEVATSLAMVAAAQGAAAHHWGLVHLLPGADSAWIRLGLMILVLDFLDYASHRAMHGLRFCWRFHLIHHTDPEVDVSTTVREHPGETAIRNLILIACVLLCGASMEALVIRQLGLTFFNITSHSRLRLPAPAARIAGLLFMTPNLHQVHHHSALPYTNRNYGDMFSLWDRLFGTLAELPRERILFGLDSQRAEADINRWAGVLALPFRPRTTVFDPA
jgi:sterol desaturase/sphingolipid hydroxylase (fatty acid hydroxylase superfamily)